MKPWVSACEIVIVRDRFGVGHFSASMLGLMTDLGHYFDSQNWWTFMRFGHCSIRETWCEFVFFQQQAFQGSTLIGHTHIFKALGNCMEMGT